MSGMKLGGSSFESHLKELTEEKRRRREEAEEQSEEIYFTNIAVQFRTKTRVPLILTNRPISSISFNRKTNELSLDGRIYEIDKRFSIPLKELIRFAKKPRYKVIVENNKIKSLSYLNGKPKTESMVIVADFEGNKKEVRVTIN